MTSIGADAITLFNTFGFDDVQAKNIDTILNFQMNHMLDGNSFVYEPFDEFLTEAKT